MKEIVNMVAGQELDLRLCCIPFFPAKLIPLSHAEPGLSRSLGTHPTIATDGLYFFKYVPVPVTQPFIVSIGAIS